MTSVGDRLKHERESRETSLEELSGSTGIGLSYLEALEHGEFEALPGRAFGKLYIRAYAEVLGFDPEPLIAAYDRERSSRERDLPPGARQPAPVMARPTRAAPPETRAEPDEGSPDGSPDGSPEDEPPAAEPIDGSGDDAEVAAAAQPAAAEDTTAEDDIDSTAAADPAAAEHKTAEDDIASGEARETPGRSTTPARPAGPRVVSPPDRPVEARAPIAGTREAALATLLRRAEADDAGGRSRAWRIGLALAAVAAVAVLAVLGIRGVGRGETPPAVEPPPADRGVRQPAADREGVIDEPAGDAEARTDAGHVPDGPGGGAELAAGADRGVRQPGGRDASGATTPTSAPAEADRADAAGGRVEPASKPVEKPGARAPDAAPTGHLSVSEHGLGREIVNRRVEVAVDRFREGEVAWFATRVVGGRRGEHIRHVWLRDGKPVQTIRLALGGTHWRTYSNKTLWGAGAWTVEARDAQGRVLASESFTCSPRSR